MNQAQEKFIIDKLRRLDGNVLATQAAIRALILRQADPDAATRAVTAQLERLVSVGLGKAISEETLEGIAEARSAIFPGPRDLRGPA